jgi:hypothetical protein
MWLLMPPPPPLPLPPIDPRSTGSGLAAAIPVAANTAPEAPSPRGAHSATLIDRIIWIFGGYGGSGYQRQEFNDLYSFDVDTMAWSKVRHNHCTLLQRSAPAPLACPHPPPSLLPA